MNASPKAKSSAKSGDGLTPLLRQFYAVKAKHPDKIVFFRMGDFFEMFGDDAIKAAPILGVALTRRGQAGSADLPLCGVPHHAAEKYLARLLAAGEKVAVVEQVEDPKTAKGVVRREVVEILTPGSATLDSLEEPAIATYLAAVSPGDNGRAGLAYLDLSTAEFKVFESETTDVAEKLAALDPREVIAPENISNEALNPLLNRVGKETLISRSDNYHFDISSGAELLRRFLNVTSLEGFGLSEKSQSIGAASAIINYLRENRRDSLNHIRSITQINHSETMELDSSSIRNLELVEGLTQSPDSPTLFGAVNLTLTAPGSRRLRRNLLAPFRNKETIRIRQEAVSESIKRKETAEAVRKKLKSLCDLERLTGRLGMRRISPRQTRALAEGALLGTGIVAEMRDLQAPLFRDSQEHYPDFSALEKLALSGLVDEPPLNTNAGGIFRRGYSQELDALNESIADAKQYMATLQERERDSTGIPSLKLGFNKVFGYYLEVTHPHRDRIPGHYIRRQTLVNAERYITEDMKRHETLILDAEEKIFKLEAELFEKLIDELAEFIPDLQFAAQTLAEIDVVFALGELASSRGYVRPQIEDRGVIEITNGRHPVIETLLEQGSFVPNDLALDDNSSSIMILTGPNMAGKSTYLRQIGHIVALAQIGSFVPADSARIGIVDRIFTRVGAVDKLARGQSTFMVEMLETANILNNATDDSLILLDEVGRGTSTFDGLSVAWALVEELHESLKARTVFATHYHELTALADELPRVVNYQVSVKRWEDQVIFLHKIIPGGCDDSYGIEVARLAGMPAKVVERARNILQELEKGDYLSSTREALSGKAQLSLFDLPAPPPSVVEERLSELEVDSLTPLDALNQLASLKRLLEKDGA